VDPVDVPDLFLRRKPYRHMGGRLSRSARAAEDTALGFCSRRLLPHMVGLPASERAAERFHAGRPDGLRTPARRCAPGPGGRTCRSGPWGTRREGSGLSRKVRREIRARAPWSTRATNAPVDPFVPLFHTTRTVIAASAGMRPGRYWMPPESMRFSGESRAAWIRVADFWCPGWRRYSLTCEQVGAGAPPHGANDRAIESPSVGLYEVRGLHHLTTEPRSSSTACSGAVVRTPAAGSAGSLAGHSR
jgi:hypothetical protein